MPTSTQISKILYYKSLGKGYTDQGKPFFEEDSSIDGNIHIVPEQIWDQANQIPDTSPFGTPDATTMSTYDGSTNGVLKYHHNLFLISKPTFGDNTYYAEELKDSIPFNYGDGTYNYFITTQGGDQIAFGQGDWIVDNDQGKITFYGSLPSGISNVNPPKISFYKYIGTKGLTNVSINTLDVSTLSISNLNGVLEAVDGSIKASTIQSLKSREMFIYGSGSESSYDLTHGLNTLKHDTTAWDSSTHEKVYPDVIRGENTDTIEFFEDVPDGQNYSIIFIGF